MKTKLRKRNGCDPNQTELVGLIWRPWRYPFRLRVGDVLRYGDRLCRVIRVTESSAVVIMNKPLRRFKTRFDKPVSFQPPPALFHIAANSEIEVLNRKTR